jgi:two-component system cell cycle sensor histidine kinase/response regulator CckA
MAFEAFRKKGRGADPAGQRALFEAMASGVWIVNPALDTQYVNPHMAALLAHTPAEIEGRTFLSFVPANGQDMVREYFGAFDKSPGRHAEVDFQRKDGSLISTIVSATPTQGTASIVCFVTDITGRREIENSLRRQAAYYQVVTAAAQDHIFVISDQDRVEYVNQAAAEQLRSSPERLIGRLRTEIFPPDVAERQGANLRKVLSEGKPLYVEGRTMYLEREVWLGTWLSPVPDESGKVTAVLGLSRDITARKRAEDELRGAEQRLRVVLSHLPLMMWASNDAGVATFCAGQALEVLGMRPEEIIGRSFDAPGLEPLAGLTEHVRRARAGEAFKSQIDVEELTFDAWSVPLRDQKQNVTGATGVFVDMTERRRLEAELSNAQKMEAIGRLAGGIAHDFNNNLTGIIGYVDMILTQIGDDKPISADLKEIQRAAERAAGLVKRLLAFGRRQVVQPRSLDLNSVVDGLKPMLERLIGENTRVVVALTPDLPSVVGDVGQIEQVIMNLALNARDAMPSGGALTIETASATKDDRPPAMASGPHVLLRIRDTGVGMDAKTRERLFEPFFTTKPVGEGTGLGLSTVYGIVKQLSGYIDVESEPGKGSTFRIFLPVTGRIPEVVPATTGPKRTVVSRETVLLVEDEDAVRRFTKLALERHGFRVIEAASPEIALSLVAESEEPVALLLTDVVMPHLSGPELAERLKEIRPELPVLYMSGYPAGMVMQGVVLDSSVRLLAKPFTTTELLTTIEDVLRKKES